MKRLATLSPVPRYDAQEIRDLWPDEAKEHPGKMRFALALEVLAWAEDYLRRRNSDIHYVGDPMFGVGTVGVAAGMKGFGTYGCEIVPKWKKIASQIVPQHSHACSIWQGDSSKVPPLPSVSFEVLLTSPPFANAHSQGKGKMQKAMLKDKQTFAGNDFAQTKRWGCTSSLERKRKKWILVMYEILSKWVRNVTPGGLVMIHNKDFVLGGKYIDTCEWVAEVFEFCGIELIGDLGAPLAYTSGFREWQRYKRQWVTSWLEPTRAMLNCGHEKVYSSPPEVRPEKAVCTHPDCHKKDHVEVMEERIIVGRR